MGLEIIDQVENLDAIVIPVGGGGLLAGVAVAIKTVYPKVQVIVSLRRFEALHTQLIKIKQFLSRSLRLCLSIEELNCLEVMRK